MLHAPGLYGGELHDVLGVVVDELEPVFGDVVGREDVVLLVLDVEALDEVVHGQAGRLGRADGALDGGFLGALDDAGDDRAADEVAAVQVLVAAAAERDLEEPVVFALAELRVDDLRDDRVDDGLAVVAMLLEERGIERQVLVDVDAVDFLRALLDRKSVV